MEPAHTKLMSIREMLVEYNSKSGKKPIKKFENRPVAEKRLNELRARLAKPNNRSEAIAATWKISAIVKKRIKRNNVTVDGVFYKSVLSAFKVLNLPVEKHIKFRIELKSAGELVWPNGEKGLLFKIVKQQELVA